MTTGTYRGVRYCRKPICEVFPHLGKALWWFVDDGSHFKTLRDLRRFVDEKEHGNV